MLTVRRLAGALVATTVGVTLITTAVLLVMSGRPIVPGRWAGAAVVVHSPRTGTPAEEFAPTVPWSAATATDLSRRLAALPGVAAAVPDRTFYAQVVSDGRPVGVAPADREGHGWSSVRLGGSVLVAGAAPRRPGEMAVAASTGRAPGDRMMLLTATGPAAYTVTGLLDGPGVPVAYGPGISVADGPGISVADEVAARLAPGVSAIGLLLEPGVDPATVAAAARPVVATAGTVLTGSGRGALEPRADARLRWIGMQILTGTAALAAFVTVFVVSSTFAFTVTRRRRELALLRAVGATPRQVRRLLRREALTVGAAGAVAGLLAGATLAPPVARALISAGVEPATFAVRYAGLPLFGAATVALLSGPVVALIAVATAAHRAARVRPLEALREAAVQQRPMGWPRWATGGVLLAAGAALGLGTATADSARSAASFALYGVMALVTGVTVLAPACVPPAVRLVCLPLRRRGGAIGELVRAGALSATRRTASTAAPVLLTVAFAVLVAGMVQTSTAAYAAGRAADVADGWVVTPDRSPGLSDAAVTVVGGTALLPTTVFADDPTGGTTGVRTRTALGVDPAAFARVDRGLSVVAGSLGDLRGADTVALSETLLPPPAGRLPDRPYPVVFADGERVELRVVAVLGAGSLPGDMLLTRSTVRAHDPSALTSAVHVRDRVAPPAGAGARVVDVAAWAAEADAAEDRLVWLFTVLLIGVSAGYGALAVANTLLMAAADRARDLRVVRLAGATRWQIHRLVAAESTLVVLIGAVLGGAVAFAGLISIRAGLEEQVGAAVDLVVPWPVIGAVVGLCLLIALVAAGSAAGVGGSATRPDRRWRTPTAGCAPGRRGRAPDRYGR